MQQLIGCDAHKTYSVFVAVNGRGEIADRQRRQGKPYLRRRERRKHFGEHPSLTEGCSKQGGSPKQTAAPASGTRRFSCG